LANATRSVRDETEKGNRCAIMALKDRGETLSLFISPAQAIANQPVHSPPPKSFTWRHGLGWMGYSGPRIRIGAAAHRGRPSLP